MNCAELIPKINSGEYDELLLDIYADENLLDYQRKRYCDTVKSFEETFAIASDHAQAGDGDRGCDGIQIYSAPGRTEIGGNHTDHQHGEVLAASINRDAVAVVKKRCDNVISILSEGYPMAKVSLDDGTMVVESEKGSIAALIRGVADGLSSRGYKIGGFNAYVTSDVLIGAGLSSSAAFEVLIGCILSGLYNGMKVPAREIAVIGQYSENVYFGKPCGLMDQTASAVGGLVHIDFMDIEKPLVESVAADFNKFGYSLCITDTKGSHADLTPEYAAVRGEMTEVAKYFGKEVLLGISMDDLINNIVGLREKLGDRAVLRAMHFIGENERVRNEVAALSCGDIDAFLANVAASGNSSFKYLQNVYAASDVMHQNVSLALAISEEFLLGRAPLGACRVHGGGFAGTIQAFVRNEVVEDYKRRMDAVFGSGSCSILRIRKYGAMQVIS